MPLEILTSLAAGLMITLIVHALRSPPANKTTASPLEAEPKKRKVTESRRESRSSATSDLEDADEIEGSEESLEEMIDGLSLELTEEPDQIAEVLEEIKHQNQRVEQLLERQEQRERADRKGETFRHYLFFVAGVGAPYLIDTLISSF
ncbi:MAG: hypothetical protein AAF191_19705 [Verrucomicrobiota bacterium]